MCGGSIIKKIMKVHYPTKQKISFYKKIGTEIKDSFDMFAHCQRNAIKSNSIHGAMISIDVSKVTCEKCLNKLNN